MSLQEFLNANLVDGITDEVAVSHRFMDKDEKPLLFTIKAMTDVEFNDLRKACTAIKKGRKVEFDSQRFNLQTVIRHTVNPNFRDAESLKKLGCASAEEYVQKVLLAGEIATLSQKISSLSGFDIEMEDLVDEAKN
ncbi:XkdN-like protein [Paenibacillus kribbensis]|uniref:phage tail assembly chaperone n=1 Tax=Paenibacillus kribbensis TaxID=172713 RepID=UPI002DB90E26|nr:XkdN-like protein [Paenibacillus kribbensis]MEC0234462.1 XkdN-like protein [Paenibacillus kribbensis]